MKRLLASVVILVAGGQLPSGQERPSTPAPAATFRVQVDAIELDAFVTDAQGNPVTGLTAADFQILEDGKPQTITSFSLVNIPIERLERPRARRAIEPDVQTNDRGDGRVYVFALDEVGTEYALRTRAFLRGFIERRFAANDMAAVFFMGLQSNVEAQPFTNSPRLLLAAIDKFSGWYPTEETPTLPPRSMAAPASRAPPPDAPNLEAHLSDRRRMSSLQDVVEAIASVHGRGKALLLISGGLPKDIFRAIDYRGGVLSAKEESAHAAVMAATRGNVTIYPIDPRGLTPGGSADEDEASLPDVTSDAPERNGLGAMDDRSSLSTLAQATGGFALTNSNSFESALDRIVRENSTYYLIGFTSTNDRRDGRYRRLRIRVNRPGLQVRSRDGYLALLKNERVAAGPTAIPAISAPVSSALVSPLAVGDVPLRVFAAPYRDTSKNAVVAITAEIDAASLDLTQQDGVFKGHLEVAFAATDTRNKTFGGEHHSVNLALKPETYDFAKRQGLRVLAEIHLPPGRYQLRLAAGSPSSKAGSVMYDLTVPDFKREPLMLSGISFALPSASNPSTLRLKDPLRDRLPGPVTAAREFTEDNTLALFSEVYENLKNAPAHTVDLRVELRSEDDRVVRTANLQRSSAEPQDKPGVYRFTVELPLKDVGAGRYIVHVEAHSSAGERRIVSRDIPIAVR